MLDLSKPLYALTIGEFISVLKQSLPSEPAEKTVFEEKTTDEHFTIGQCANFLNCSKVSIHNYKRLGLPFYRIGRKVLFKKSEVLQFMSGKFVKHFKRRKTA